MLTRLVSFVFFANYFVGFLAIALSVETVFQLKLPLNSLPYYILLFSATVFYYTMAYSVPDSPEVSANPRTEWYRIHAPFVRRSQVVLFMVCTALGLWLLVYDFTKILELPVYFWLLVAAIPGAAIFYYGLLPESVIAINLRRTGWLKAFVIGFVWAGCVNLFPIIMLKIERNIVIQEPELMLWLFLKNWMFCTVNAIMFDIKDYEDDANIELKTFAVRFGLRNTIFYILIPFLLIGLLSFLIFAVHSGFPLVTFLFNLIPFICLLLVAFSLQKPRKILYYLIVIDGLLLVKAICGIAGSFL
ncbi:UbiA family prenyltransferase [Dyadobacter arcticus]|uniref:4-hydroxybenzoate polyprenyltransferase n=1 Tax=Dyadobacter arcticus TaxID=1078754 RepID=A0ABX0UN64_9BACT|nr:UbiA family prenyltransferase [Dyadobacter arcticus]NIJ53424.1 4-hydroxybenzoate polyprenyltransferase [Dyadobacter arcticus]